MFALTLDAESCGTATHPIADEGVKAEPHGHGHVATVAHDTHEGAHESVLRVGDHGSIKISEVDEREAKVGTGSNWQSGMSG